MAVALRAHHLLCILTYVGKGYSPDFVANYDVIAGRLTAGERIRIVDGPDDICAPLFDTDDRPHCLSPRATIRDQWAARALEPLIGYPLSAGAHVLLDRERLRHLRSTFAAGLFHETCDGCEWKELCTSVARSNYTETRI